ncbi:NADH-quinone oxidoreductase subunit L [Candidatus Aerophobetes bacterium]|nr:NADH-quinone oxidoreductase subunit L [Candidatus Aerophobetes bacterium]
MAINIILIPILLPLIFGILSLLIPQRFKKIYQGIAVIGSLITFILTIFLFFQKPLEWVRDSSIILRLDNLSGFILLAIGLFGFLITLYSLKFMQGKSRLKEYYAYILWTIAAACGAVLANNLILLVIFWGFLGLTLYLLIGMGEVDAGAAAKKAFIIVGGSDSLMIFGIGIIWFLTKTLAMDKINIPISGGLSLVAFLCLMIASFAKAGAMPVHSWIPDYAEKAPLSVTAFLPASLDKLLGIYLLARICMNMFQLNYSINLILLIIGAITIVAAVFMAMVQHDLKRLLSFHAISQVGYMVLGIGTGNPIGIAGGLFHMLNNAIYKSCLFLTGGSVQHKTGTTNLDKLGGLAKLMPITFTACLIAALSISGVPPFNGFVSKWMIYQGIVELGREGSKLWVIWLAAAMFGSALTLASFMKLIHATFLGASSSTAHQSSSKKEVHWTMWLPMVVLAGLCVIFGVFAYALPLKHFILPAVPEISYLGVWSPGLATLLIIIGIIIGAVIYRVGKLKKNLREDTSYIGGEVLSSENRVTGTEFYDTIKDVGLLKWVYKKAEEKLFDIYDQGARLVFLFTKGLQKVHTGILTNYLVWCLVGMLILFLVLIR